MKVWDWVVAYHKTAITVMLIACVILVVLSVISECQKPIAPPTVEQTATRQQTDVVTRTTQDIATVKAKLSTLEADNARIKAQLVKTQASRTSIKAPASDDELVGRFVALGYHPVYMSR